MKVQAPLEPPTEVTDCDAALWEAADLIASTLGKADPRSWRWLLLNCPDWLVLERAEAIHGNIKEAQGGRPDDRAAGD